MKPASFSIIRRHARRHLAILLVLLFVAPWHFAWTSNAALGDIGADGPYYLMMAEDYSPYQARDPVYRETATYSRFPPLYPMVLAGLGAADELSRAHQVTTGCLLLALLAFYGWLLQAGLSPGPSSLLVLLFAVLPGTWMLGLFVQSEYLYLFLSLLAITLMQSYRARTRPELPSSELLYAAALSTAAAVLTRTVGVSLLPPLLLMLWRAPRRTAAACCCISLFPPVAWQLVHRSHLGYAEAWSSIYGAGGWAFLRHQLLAELPALRDGFIANFLHDGTALRPLAYVLGLIGLGAAALRMIRLKPDAVYVFVHLAILLVWPYPEEARRFMWVLLPVLLAQPLIEYRERRGAAADVRPLGIAIVALALAILAMALPALAFGVERYRAAADSDLPGAAGFLLWYRTDPAAATQAVTVQQSIINSLRLMPDHVPASDCVISTRPDLVNYFGRRRSVVPPLNSIPEPYFTVGIRRTGCHFVFAMIGTDSRFPLPMHPVQRLQSELEPVYVTNAPDEVAASHPVIAALLKLRN